MRALALDCPGPRAALAVAATLACGGLACGDGARGIDPFPVPVTIDPGTGVPIAAVTTPGLDDQRRVAVIDTGSPFTLVDPLALATGTPDRRPLDVTLHAPAGPPRAEFTGHTVLVTPAGNAGGNAPGATPFPVQAVLGGDLLKDVAVRFDVARGELRFFPDVAGDAADLEDACLAVLQAPVRGGGKLTFAGGEVAFPATRLIASACLNPGDPTASPLTTSGHDALLVVATGVPIPVITRSAWASTPGAPDLASLPTGRIYLPGDSGPGADVHYGSLARLALVANEEERGPCRELLTGRIMETGGCRANDECLCKNEELICASAASVELTRALPVAIVADTHPLIQSLRNELRPGTGDVDGVLGLDALADLVMDIDYPNSRIVVRCNDTTTNCLTRPRLESERRREQLAACLVDGR